MLWFFYKFFVVVVVVRSRRMLGLCYVTVKVSLLVVMEIGMFPLTCGWWLDICSLVNIYVGYILDLTYLT